MGENRSQIKPLYGTPLNYAHWAAQGLVGCWLFNEGSGDKAYDYSGQGNTGTLTNMSPMSATSGWVPGPHGGALAFDGSDDYVDCGSIFNRGATASFTIVVSYRPNNITGTQIILSKKQSVSAATDAGFSCYQTGANMVCLIADGVNRAFSSMGGQEAVWNSYAFLIDRAKNISAIYKNGRLASSIASTAGVGDTTNSIGLFFGKAPFSGLISHVSIYNRALSAEEIAYLYAFPYCMFEDQSGTGLWIADASAAVRRIPMHGQKPCIGNAL